MKYVSTRGQTPPLSFSDAVLTGLAPDGGLLVPESIPDVRPHLDDWRELPFVELAKRIVGLYADDIPSATLGRLIDEAYATFSEDEVVVLRSLGDVEVLELFHGPTLAFKDVALQLLGRLFEYILTERGQHLNIVGATSGDTGSAAIEGVRGQGNIDIFVMFPKGRVSPLQELQMTSVADENVHCLAVDGSFDDCQTLMKSLFADLEFKQKYQLGAVNSVNWARVLAQIVYYAYASLRTTQQGNLTTFAVPTGNFGNIFAGYLAKRMGFPIAQLLLATNENDILSRFFATGEYSRGKVRYTLTPAMDIQVASNFERFLYYYMNQDAGLLTEFMQQFTDSGSASVGGPPDADEFLATAVKESEVLAVIAETQAEHNYVVDPHSAVGIAAAKQLGLLKTNAGPLVCIATAHPAKFPEAVAKAVPGLDVTHPTLEKLRDQPTRCKNLAADLDALKAFIVDTLS